MVLVSEPVRGRSRATELPCYNKNISGTEWPTRVPCPVLTKFKSNHTNIIIKCTPPVHNGCFLYRRNEFDEERVPCLTDECYLQDIHSISSLVKAYFRDLPNPLFTFQLYDKFFVSFPCFVAILRHVLRPC